MRRRDLEAPIPAPKEGGGEVHLGEAPPPCRHSCSGVRFLRLCEARSTPRHTSVYAGRLQGGNAAGSSSGLQLGVCFQVRTCTHTRDTHTGHAGKLRRCIGSSRLWSSRPSGPSTPTPKAPSAPSPLPGLPAWATSTPTLLRW